MTLNQYIRDCISRLSPVYDEGEARWLMRISIEHLKGWTQTDIALRGDEEIDPELSGKIDAIIGRLLKSEPIQYILGETYWHGLTLKVRPGVLIPREETSELVDIIENDNRQSDLRVLDVCTGSGCIAVALAKALPFSSVTASDISDVALGVARENAELNKVKIDFVKSDALKPTPTPKASFDIIVSNPPYIAQSEDRLMKPNVLDYEPHSALFVPDNDPLMFYRSISESARGQIKPGGRLYFEINPLFRNQLCDMLGQHGWLEVTSIKDIHGKDRFVSAKSPSL